MTHDTISGTTEVSERDIHLPAHLFIRSKLSNTLSFGFGVTSPFGLSANWEDSSTVRYVSTFSKVVTLELNPNIAYKVNNDLSLAVGMNYIQMRATMEKLLPLPGDPNFRLNGDGTGWGVNAAVKYQSSDAVAVGLSYRSRIKVDLDGTAGVTGSVNLSNSANTNITLPDLIQFGVSYKASDNITLNSDIDYTMWSTYDRLVVTSNTLAVLTGGATDTQTSEKRWKNALCFRIGGQYRMNDQWKLRAGYVYDQDPVPESHFDTAVPDADRQGITIGAGYSSGKIMVDVAYLYLKFMNRTITNSLADDGTPTPNALNGTYRSQAQLAAITVGYAF